MTLGLLLAFAALLPETGAQKQVRLLEERLHPFPLAAVVTDNANFAHRYVQWLILAGAVAPDHQRQAYAAQLSDAQTLYDAWMYLETVQMLVKEVRYLADAGRKNNASPSNKLCVRTVEELLEAAEQYTDTLVTLLGEADFHAGRMPPCVPYWCFQDIDR